jgi:PAS domain S-box-containing protein
MTTALRVLLVEDDPDDHVLTRMLVDAIPDDRVELHWQPTFHGALAAIGHEAYDVLLVDYRLGVRTGLEFIHEARRLHCTTPVVVLTGLGDRDLDQQAMRSGAADYLVKAEMDAPLLGRTLRHAAQRHEAGEAAARLAAIVESSSDAIYAVAPDGTVATWNSAAERIYGYTAAEMAGEPLFRLVPPEGEAELRASLARVLHGERVEGSETVQLCRDGRRIAVSLSLSPIRDAAGRVGFASLIARDVTERKRLEEQYRQAQKLEVVGRLAGGVAHDFNNLLTAIRGTADVLLADLDEANPMRPDLLEIRRASEGAASLTRQLLAFSRQQVVQPRVVDVNAAVAETDRMLRRVIGEDVELVTVLSPEAGCVRVDPVQIEQVLTNLALNARDAMPHGGRLLVQTQAVQVEEGGSPGWPGVPPGHHVMLAVSDNGTGMDAGTRERVFEPFFTTKPQGRGTGLGLATVYGIVQQSGGHVLVHSEPDEGTTFQVFLPREAGAAEAAAAGVEPGPPARGSETVLLVEDEASVRLLIRRILVRQGYTVLEAGDGEEGLRVWEGNRGGVALVVTDTVMPLMGGREMARRIHEVQPGVPIILMSGYSQDERAMREPGHDGTEFISKPFDVNEFGRTVRRVLDGSGAAAPVG